MTVVDETTMAPDREVLVVNLAEAMKRTNKTWKAHEKAMVAKDIAERALKEYDKAQGQKGAQ